MITVKTLKTLLKQIPDTALVWGYEGEDIGIGVIEGDDNRDSKTWWIRATGSGEDNYTEGFDR